MILLIISVKNYRLSLITEVFKLVKLLLAMPEISTAAIIFCNETLKLF